MVYFLGVSINDGYEDSDSSSNTGDSEDLFEKLTSDPRLTDVERQSLVDNESEVRRLMSDWSEGTFNDVSESIVYHFIEHGRRYNIDVLKYLRQAQGMYQRIASRNIPKGWIRDLVVDRTDPTGEIKIPRYTANNGQRFIIVDNSHPPKIRSFGNN